MKIPISHGTFEFAGHLFTWSRYPRNEVVVDFLDLAARESYAEPEAVIEIATAYYWEKIGVREEESEV